MSLPENPFTPDNTLERDIDQVEQSLANAITHDDRVTRGANEEELLENGGQVIESVGKLIV